MMDEKFEKLSKYIMEFTLDNPDNVEEIERLRKGFYKKYIEFFKSETFGNKLKTLKKYLSGNWNKELRGESRYEKISSAIEIYKSSLSDFEKAYQINSLMTLYKLFEAIKPFVVVLGNNEFIKDAINIYSFMKKYGSELDLIRTDYKYFEYYKEYLKDYQYAKYVIESYLQFTSCDLGLFLKSLGIKMQTFEYFVNVICEVDRDLYDKYIVKYNENCKLFLDSYIERIMEIKKGIETHKMSDGTNFTRLDFWRLIPLVDNDVSFEIMTLFRRLNSNLMISTANDFVRRVEKFMSVFVPSAHDIVFSYIKENGINNRSVMKMNNKVYYNYLINGVNIDDSANDKIVKYINDNNLPMIRAVYHEVVLMYVNDELDNKKLSR